MATPSYYTEDECINLTLDILASAHNSLADLRQIALQLDNGAMSTKKVKDKPAFLVEALKTLYDDVFSDNLFSGGRLKAHNNIVRAIFRNDKDFSKCVPFPKDGSIKVSVPDIPAGHPWRPTGYKEYKAGHNTDPLTFAFAKNEPSLFKLLLENRSPGIPHAGLSRICADDGVSWGEHCISPGRAALLEIMLSGESSLPVPDFDGNTLLHKAKSKEIACILLKNGAELNTENKKRENPIYTWSCNTGIGRKALKNMIKAAHASGCSPSQCNRGIARHSVRIGNRRGISKKMIREFRNRPDKNGYTLLDYKIYGMLTTVLRTERVRQKDLKILDKIMENQAGPLLPRTRGVVFSALILRESFSSMSSNPRVSLAHKNRWPCPFYHSGNQMTYHTTATQRIFTYALKHNLVSSSGTSGYVLNLGEGDMENMKETWMKVMGDVCTYGPFKTRTRGSKMLECMLYVLSEYDKYEALDFAATISEYFADQLLGESGDLVGDTFAIPTGMLADVFDFSKKNPEGVVSVMEVASLWSRAPGDQAKNFAKDLAKLAPDEIDKMTPRINLAIKNARRNCPDLGEAWAIELEKANRLKATGKTGNKRPQRRRPGQRL